MGIFQNSAVIGLFRQERRYELISNNLSNALTPGFKKDVPIFHEVFSEALHPSLSTLSMDSEFSQTLLQQGEIQSTRNPLDLAIEGEGFFKVKTPEGVRYTRNGNFRLTREGVLIQSNGFPVLSRNGEITLRGNQIAVEKDGAIKVDGADRDKLALITFADLKALKKEGKTLFKLEGEQEEKEAEGAGVIQGALEGSNVNAMEEMVQMIDSLRTFEACYKIVQVQDELNAKSVNELAKV
ncbi:MAG: flagellar basal-body rod protein FlgF [Deltaproteobacteria bacterium]|nr:flagellar basal-body rod protein FlgF [Deltaproteobacteria bacterium]